MKPPTTQSPTETAIERAAAYTLLAHCFAYPDAANIAALHEAALEAKALASDIGILRLASIADEVPQESLEAAFVAMSTFSTSPDVPLFETAYFGGEAQQQTQRMADIAGFFRAFGVEAMTGDVRPDDLPVELEFLAYLCRKEAYAREHMGAPRVAQARRAQRLFISEHIGRWAPVAGRKLAASEVAGPFYRLCGQTLHAWLTREAAALGAAPESVSGEVSKDWPQPASHGPEFAGDANFIPISELTVR